MLLSLEEGVKSFSVSFAQQGSMLVFIAQIFIYAAQMNKLDRKFDVHED